MTSFWKLTHRFPPCLVRMLARHQRGPLKTDEEIAKDGGLHSVMVRLLSSATDWDHTELGLMRRYLQGCGIDFENRIKMKRLHEYISRHPRLLYLRNDPEWESRWKPLLLKWRAAHIN